MEWELFILTALSYSAPVRTEARARLLALQAHDDATLSDAHARVAAGLEAMDDTSNFGTQLAVSSYPAGTSAGTQEGAQMCGREFERFG